MTTPHAAAWRTELTRRARHLFLLKLVGTSAWIWVFFLCYFHLLRHPMFAVTRMPLTALDALVPFQPLMLGPYLSLWLYVGIAPGLMPNFRALLTYGLWTAGLCLAGLAFFCLWPTAVPPETSRVSDLLGLRMLQDIDANGNACPSMHVAFAMFSCLWIEHILGRAGAPTWLRSVNVAWFLAITWSTLAIRQHVVLDALAGGALGAAFAGTSLLWRGPATRVLARRGRAAMIDRIPENSPP
ncbi:MAG: phosphatase PAP2 family protein [Pseudomonadota bacterium]|nr:phosphatase PAP2 family protein [Pseudomonadota bacterium]